MYIYSVKEKTTKKLFKMRAFSLEKQKTGLSFDFELGGVHWNVTTYR